MLTLKRSSLLLFGLLLTIFVAACGGTTTTTGSTSMGNTQTKSTTMMNATPTAATTMAPQPAAQPTTTGQMNNNNNNTMMNNNAFIKTTQVMINGKMVTVLTNTKGMILYYKLNDPKPASACTGACAQAWPPVIANAMDMMVSSSMQLPHKLTVFKTANGNQIEYDSHPLYTYAGDMTPGQFTGRGMGNVWYLVSTAL
jgi:predicted lipoprotein with Yx(FWY)xxD motif